MARSDDGGATWSHLDDDSFASIVDARSLAADGAGGVLLRAGAPDSDRGVVRSIDGGMTWISSGAGLPKEAEVTGFAFDRQRPMTVFAATSSRGVYRSDDGGQSWTPTS